MTRSPVLQRSLASAIRDAELLDFLDELAMARVTQDQHGYWHVFLASERTATGYVFIRDAVEAAYRRVQDRRERA